MLLGERYKTVEYIASGGMGEVWKAMDVKLEREVAVKIVNSHFTNKNKGAVKILKAEAISGSKLMGSRNTVTILDLCETEINGDITHFIVMELINGKTLSDWLKEDAIKLEAKTRHTCLLYIALEICNAIYYSHRYKILHRDIKPLNVFISLDGSVKVGDFGLSKFVDEATRSHTVNNISSAYYTAPEQWIGRKHVVETDAYQLGVTVYEILTGRVPFDGSKSTIMYKHINDTPEDIKTLNPLVSDEINEIVIGMLKKKEDERTDIWKLIDILAKEVQKGYKLKVDLTKLSKKKVTLVNEITDFNTEDGVDTSFFVPDYREAISESIELTLNEIYTMTLINES